MANKINFKELDTLLMLREAAGIAENKTRERRRELVNPTDMEIEHSRVKEAEYSLLHAQLYLEWRLSLNKQYADVGDAIENKKDKLQADIAKLDVERAQQHLDAAESSYRLILSQQMPVGVDWDDL